MSKKTVEAARSIDIPWLKREGYFPAMGATVSGSVGWSFNGESLGDVGLSVTTRGGSPRIRFGYRFKKLSSPSESDWERRDYSIPLEQLPCPYGGYKWFFRCQMTKQGVFCGRRVRVLYLVNGWFGCRQCVNLTYDSCQRGGRYKGFISRAYVEAYREKIGRTFYNSKPTRKFRRYVVLCRKYREGMEMRRAWLEKLTGKHLKCEVL